MKFYAIPLIQTIDSKSNGLLFLRAQATGADTGASTFPSNPDINCATLDCTRGQPDTGNLTVVWNDNPGSNVAGYVVVVKIGDLTSPPLTDNTLTVNTTGCGITESPAGTYTLQCTGYHVEPGCGCAKTDFHLISITDGDGHVLPVSTENCGFIQPQPC